MKSKITQEMRATIEIHKSKRARKILRQNYRANPYATKTAIDRAKSFGE